MGEVEALRVRLREFAQARDWEQFHSPKNLVMALSVEVAELMEHFQWLTEAQSLEISEKARDEVAMEIADVFIYLLRLADQLGVDPMQVATRKIEINEQRYPVELSRGKAGRPDKSSK
jgi:NTP pyrophosphatase (non-canonical NTP hydrolase)